MKNTLTDLNNLIFEQMETLAQADEKELDNVVKRAKAINSLASTAVKSFDIALQARKAQLEYALDNDLIQIGDKHV